MFVTSYLLLEKRFQKHYLRKYIYQKALLYSTGFYELCRTHFSQPDGNVGALPFWATMASGGVAGFSYWFLTYPSDVVKSAMQSDHSEVHKRRFTGILHCAKTLYIEEGGWRRFFRGFTPCLMRSILANATMLVTLEKCRHLFTKFQ